MVARVFIGTLLLLAGCGSEGPPTPFQGDPTRPTFEGKVEIGGQEPETAAPTIVANPEGPYCKKDASGNYVSAANLVASKGVDAQKTSFAVGGGCLFRPIREAWAVLHSSAGVKWKDADLTGFSRKADPRVDFLFLSVNEAGPFFARQEWTIEWYQKVTQGTLAVPEYLVVQYSKVKGTSHIAHWKGILELKKLAEAVTSVAIRNEVRGTRIDPTSAAGGLTDLFTNLSQLGPDWTYLGNP